MSKLFQPITVGDLQLANRIVMAPLTRNRSPNAVPQPITATYYAQRASAGLLITEPRRCRIRARAMPMCPACMRPSNWRAGAA